MDLEAQANNKKMTANYNDSILLKGFQPIHAEEFNDWWEHCGQDDFADHVAAAYANGPRMLYEVSTLHIEEQDPETLIIIGGAFDEHEIRHFKKWFNEHGHPQFNKHLNSIDEQEAALEILEVTYADEIEIELDDEVVKRIEASYNKTTNVNKITLDSLIEDNIVDKDE